MEGIIGLARIRENSSPLGVESGGGGGNCSGHAKSALESEPRALGKATHHEKLKGLILLLNETRKQSSQGPCNKRKFCAPFFSFGRINVRCYLRT